MRDGRNELDGLKKKKRKKEDEESEHLNMSPHKCIAACITAHTCMHHHHNACRQMRIWCVINYMLMGIFFCPHHSFRRELSIYLFSSSKLMQIFSSFNLIWMPCLWKINITHSCCSTEMSKVALPGSAQKSASPSSWTQLHIKS